MKALNVVYYTGSIIALSSTSSVAVFSWMLFQIIDFKLLIVIFTITIGSYTLDRVVGVEKDKLDHPIRSMFFKQHRNFLSIFSIAILAIGIFFAFWHSILFGTLAIIAPIFVLAYSYENKKSGVSLKKIPFIKDFIIAGGWTALILIVIVYNNISITTTVIFFSIGIFSKFYVMAVLYDFKDISSDLKNGIRTLPNTFGEHSTKTILNLVNIISTFWLISLVYYGLISQIGYIFIPACAYQMMLIGRVTQNAPKWVYYLLCDLEQVTWLLFAVILVMLWA